MRANGVEQAYNQFSADKKQTVTMGQAFIDGCDFQQSKAVEEDCDIADM